MFAFFHLTKGGVFSKNSSNHLMSLWKYTFRIRLWIFILYFFIECHRTSADDISLSIVAACCLFDSPAKEKLKFFSMSPGLASWITSTVNGNDLGVVTVSLVWILGFERTGHSLLDLSHSSIWLYLKVFLNPYLKKMKIS